MGALQAQQLLKDVKKKLLHMDTFQFTSVLLPEQRGLVGLRKNISMKGREGHVKDKRKDITISILLWFSTSSVQPSCPKSSVNFFSFSRSCSLTVGFVLERDLSMSDMETIGSKSFSPGTSIHVISLACGSPGEQGVRRSSTMTFGSLLDGPRTCLK